MSCPEFTILGAGAIGSILAAHLVQAGHSVAVIARGQRARELQERGLRIVGMADLSVPVHVVTDPSEVTSTDVLVVAIKTPGTEAALNALSHIHLGLAFSIQNGVLKNTLLAKTFGDNLILGALADTSGELLPSGAVTFTRNANLLLGEITGEESDRATTVARALNNAGIRATAVTDIVPREWGKFVTWLPLMGMSVTMRTVTWRYLIETHSALVFVRMVHEATSVARALGIEPFADGALLALHTVLKASESEAVEAVRRLGDQFRTSAPNHRVSALQDLERGRPLEVDETFGHVVALASNFGQRVPLLETFYHLISAIDHARNGFHR